MTEYGSARLVAAAYAHHFQSRNIDHDAMGSGIVYNHRQHIENNRNVIVYHESTPNRIVKMVSI